MDTAVIVVGLLALECGVREQIAFFPEMRDVKFHQNATILYFCDNIVFPKYLSDQLETVTLVFFEDFSG